MSPPAGAAALALTAVSQEEWLPLIENVGLGGDIAQRILDLLARSRGDGQGVLGPWFALWQGHCSRYFDLNAAETHLAGLVRSPPGSRLFLAQAYGKIVLAEFVALAFGRSSAGSTAASLYRWLDFLDNAELAARRRDLRRLIAASAEPARLDAAACSSVLAAIYQEIFPPPLRHLLGEYYTPPWLVAYCIGQAQRHAADIVGPITILDPAAGSGSFLAHAMTHLGATGHPAPVKIVGFDINPLAVDFCRANTLLAASKANRTGRGPAFDIRIHLADAVADPAPDLDVPVTAAEAFRTTDIENVFLRTDESQAACDEAAHSSAMPAAMREAFLRVLRQHASDIRAACRSAGANMIVGNPPWIAWDGLTRRYRDFLAPQWAASTLLVNKGWRARVAAGKTDFSSLFVYRAAQRHAAANAVMVFVLPLSLFQSHLAGAGFRRFRTAQGRSFALIALDDFSSVKVFRDAVNRTSVGTFAVDQPQRFPIRYATWSPVHQAGGDGWLACESAPGGPLAASVPNSPIVAFTDGQTQPEMSAGKSDYRARGGVNTGGANTILWLDVLAHGDSTCTVRNIATSRRGSSPVVVAEIEKDAVYPLLRGVDMRRWQAAPTKSILLLYSPDAPKKALPPDRVESRFPRALAFVSQFRQQLEGRKEFQRWGSRGPFYEVYRIGPYTFSPIKVAWQHTGYRKRLNVSVVDDRGRRPAIPDQKVILIPFDDIDEAHYACAFLSSSVTAALLDRYLGADASTHILDYVALRKFAPQDEHHRRLSTLSVLAHQAAAAGGDVAPLENEIDAIVARLRR